MTQKASKSGGKAHRMTGLQRGLLMLALFLSVLACAAGAFLATVIAPVEVNPPEPQAETPQEDTFEPPTVVEVTTEVDEETGKETLVETEVPASHKEDFYNILLLGTDDDGTRTDTIMIGRLDVSNHTVALLSVPRDTLIEGDYRIPKINSVYGKAGKGEAGIRALQQKLAQTLGFETDGYVMVNLNAFIELVDLVGGVEFDVPVKMDYEDPGQNLYIHLDEGPQLLDGYNAMGLVRFRKGYATQDIGRTQVQQQFLKALAKKCMSISNLAKISEFSQIFMENVTTDLSIGNVVYFAQELLKCDFDNLFAFTLQGEEVIIDEISYYAIYAHKTLQVVNEQFNPYETALTEEDLSILTPEKVRAEQAEQEPEEEELIPKEEDPIPEEELWETEEPETTRPEKMPWQ